MQLKKNHLEKRNLERTKYECIILSEKKFSDKIKLWEKQKLLFNPSLSRQMSQRQYNYLKKMIFELMKKNRIQRSSRRRRKAKKRRK